MSDKYLVGYLVWDGLAGVADSDLVVCYQWAESATAKPKKQRRLPDVSQELPFLTTAYLSNLDSQKYADKRVDISLDDVLVKVSPDQNLDVAMVSADGDVRAMRKVRVDSFVLNGGQLLKEPHRFSDFSEIRPYLGRIGAG